MNSIGLGTKPFRIYELSYTLSKFFDQLCCYIQNLFTPDIVYNCVNIVVLTIIACYPELLLYCFLFVFQLIHKCFVDQH